MNVQFLSDAEGRVCDAVMAGIEFTITVGVRHGRAGFTVTRADGVSVDAIEALALVANIGQQALMLAVEMTRTPNPMEVH